MASTVLRLVSLVVALSGTAVLRAEISVERSVGDARIERVDISVPPISSFWILASRLVSDKVWSAPSNAIVSGLGNSSLLIFALALLAP